MKVNRHGKPHSSYLATLKRKALKHDWERLVNACVEAILTGEQDVVVAFSYVLKLPRDFPRGILEEKVEDKNIHRIKVRKLYEWLLEKGHATASMSELSNRMREFSRAYNKLDRFDEIGVDEYQEEAHNAVYQLNTEEN